MTDPRAERTRARLREALLAECAERPLEEVSVAAVVRRAGLGRATFYLHYTDLQALAVDACAEVVRDAVEALHAWRGVPDPAAPPPALTEFFTGIAPHTPLYRTLLREGGSGPLGDLLHHELRARSQRERELAGAPAAALIASAVASTFAGVLADWLHGLIDATPAAMASHTWRLLLSLHRTPLE
ncbi:TetR/AcrR family transcriptional regulator [Streptomyces lunaelactis]|uniref:TetR/AcrR family transcriptional regulator n=1 Tax=Streptomyces lunaelactis TaxID=1535768 RepID=UPI001584EF1B|nr:TetR/AcrR family transcriptional regulator [Streptomyces lunaelactis]NUK06018.1 TetR/AcrR family transcriptional regulator [Streptomyces lunaelactis]NUK10963.1 TetR/AcrR family transcriptional regulator [Streptomyces lunaelactis]NUK18605.1 TetR/AcrR family transcriptional regulator [Streptomyces lunaelactis]NUK27240.1 TetR/AcrR family transcriptional regulator [Streptomyces lunaelactis]NUK35993.1 TetR/AcrR family transcriptional regulator [Streptomyces lunaelactis]